MVHEPRCKPGRAIKHSDIKISNDIPVLPESRQLKRNLSGRWHSFKLLTVQRHGYVTDLEDFYFNHAKNAPKYLYVAINLFIAISLLVYEREYFIHYTRDGVHKYIYHPSVKFMIVFQRNALTYIKVKTKFSDYASLKRKRNKNTLVKEKSFVR